MKTTIESLSEKEQITALRKLLFESLGELEYLLSHPRVASTNINSILERGKVALGIESLCGDFHA